jgi:hypothetical protein
MKLLLLFICILTSSLSFGQKKKYPPPPPLFTNFVRNNTIKYSLQKRISFYPFSKSSQIKIVSFGLQLDSVQRKEENYYKLPMRNDTICFSKLDESKSLTLNQIDTLTDILYNECSRWNIRAVDEYGCYFPRNAILFFDNSGKVFEYIEICFECLGLKLSSTKIKPPDLCNDMYNHLQSYFKKIDIQTSAVELKSSSK